MLQVENGNTVSVHYRGTLNDGTEFDSSHSRGEPLSFQVGSGQMINGFDAALPRHVSRSRPEPGWIPPGARGALGML